MPPSRPPLSIILPPNSSDNAPFATPQMPRTPERRHEEQSSAVEPPPPPQAQPFKVRRRRVTGHRESLDNATDCNIIPSIEMSEAPALDTSPSIRSPRSAHLLSPMLIPSNYSRSITPPKTPAPRAGYPVFSQIESPAEEWDLINKTTRPFERANSICSSFSDSSISSCGSSAFSLPTTGTCDSPTSDATDPFLDDTTAKPPRLAKAYDLDQSAPHAKRVKLRSEPQWSAQMDEHLWMTFMAYLSDPTLTPFKLLPGSTPPMGVCDQVATKAKRTWRSRRVVSLNTDSIDALVEANASSAREGSPDTIRPSSLQAYPTRWPKVAATRKRLRHLVQTRPSISAHYQRMLRTRSPSPFETSSPPRREENRQATFSSHEMIHSLVTATAPSMQPDAPLVQLSREAPASRPGSQRDSRPDDWYACIGRAQAHRKSESLQSELNITVEDVSTTSTAGQTSQPLASPFNLDVMPSRMHSLQRIVGTKSLGRTEVNGRSLASPLVFKQGAPTERRSRKRRFRSDEEKPRRPALEDVFGPPDHTPVTRNRGFTVGATNASDSLARMLTPTVTDGDQVMTDAPNTLYVTSAVPSGSHSAPRRLAEPVPRLGSPFVETPFLNRHRNTFPRGNVNQSQDPFQPTQDHRTTGGILPPPRFPRLS